MLLFCLNASVLFQNIFFNLRNTPLTEEAEKSAQAMRNWKPNEKWESKQANKN